MLRRSRTLQGDVLEGSERSDSRRNFLGAGAALVTAAVAVGVTAEPAAASSLLQEVYSGSSGIPAWTTGTAYSVNQLVRVGPAVFICATAHTSSGSTFPGTGVDWQAVGAPPLTISVDAFGADGTGTNSSDAAVTAARTALGSAGGSLVFGAGTYKLANPIATLGPGQGILGQGKNATIIKFSGSGALMYAYDPGSYGSSGSPKVGGVFSGFTIDGTSAAVNSAGIRFGDLTGSRLQNIKIQNFAASGCAGLHMDCVITWCERSNIEIEFSNNATAVLFDNHITGQAYAGTSYDYSSYQFTMSVAANQNGIVVQNGSVFVGVDMTVRGNFQTGATNTGTAITIGSDSSGIYSSFSASRLDWQVETDGDTGVAHSSILIGANGGIGQCYGIMNFLDGADIPFTNPSLSSSNFAFTGLVSIPGAPVLQVAPGLALTSSSQGSQQNLWVQVASITLTAEYFDIAARLQVQADGGVPGVASAATVTFRVKQQAAMGSPPYMGVYAENCEAFTPYQFVAVLTANTLSQTVAQLWMQAPQNYENYNWSYVAISGTSTNSIFNWATPSATWQSAPPSGTSQTSVPGPGVVNVASGTAPLAGGTVTIANPAVTANTIVRLSRQKLGGTPGELSVALTAGAGFKINSYSASETSTVFWEIVSF